ncbi:MULTISPECIES: hypothetical protein [unclassified Streptomyces]|uniref:hypothetical protein n=1 Tax=unclassified Streptomyces TaxID=2593676 RepID=UPI002E8244A7|nr:hypothetical protein [Streptomyces sp. NBC_00589]WTI41923.1 hypothetical protein OIC96_46600 [Streptomyces sp. NBC_00775]WUB24394.1 hypothetical protein OHA51_03120 [Streptomyces sp. NBC_00589]
MTSWNRSTSPEDCSALGGLRAGVRQHDPHGDIACHAYSEIGLTLYFAACESLCGASIDALRGPQVLADGAALVGRVPSELEQWLFYRAESREPYTELLYLPGADAGSLTFGLVLCVQRAGDRLATRPVFLPAAAIDDVYHPLPREAWAIF